VYEIFDHTADLGLRVSAPSFAQLCEEAATGLTRIIAGDASHVRPVTAETFAVGGADPSLVLFDWLNEILYAFEARRMLFVQFEVAAPGDGGLRAVARGERYDPARHALAHEVKAITYHGLEARCTPTERGERWEATVIVDV